MINDLTNLIPNEDIVSETTIEISEKGETKVFKKNDDVKMIGGHFAKSYWRWLQSIFAAAFWISLAACILSCCWINC